MGIVNQNAFLVADSIILVSDISLNGIQGAELFIELWANARRHLRKDDNVKALILNNFDKRIKLSAELVEYTEENESTKGIVLKTVIPSSVQVKNCEIEHRTINFIHKNSQIHGAYKNVLRELKERGVL
jgi:chromosome partitioning protein